MAHIRQSRPDSGLGVQAKVLEPFLQVKFLETFPFQVTVLERCSLFALKRTIVN
jgi:hypothetical protein